MSKRFQKKELLPDARFDNLLVAKFINQIMLGGKKSTARRVVYGAFDIIKEQTKQDPADVFERAIKTVGPSVEVRPKRIGGATYQVPMEVKDSRRISLAMRWLIGAARAKKGQSMEKRLSSELISASKNEGEAIKKKINVEKMAAANRAFAHLAHRRKKKKTT